MRQKCKTRFSRSDPVDVWRLCAYERDKIIARFWAKVDRSGECWEWLGSCDGRGYGTFKVASKTIRKAHRVAFSIHHQRPPGDGLVVRHLCHNRACCNPSHLAEGTHQENSDDMKRAGRQGRPDVRGEKNPSARLSIADVVAIKGRIEAGERNTDIARDYPVSHALVSSIRRGKAWSGVHIENLAA
jgi:Autographiviridae endonuclease